MYEHGWGVEKSHEPPKTDSSRQPLPIPPQAVDALRAWKKEASFTAPGDWVFASEYHFGKQPLWPGTLWRRNVVPAIERAGITKPKLGWHTLRRSYASLLLSTGIGLRVSMELMRQLHTGDDAKYIRTGGWEREEGCRGENCLASAGRREGRLAV